MNLFSSKKPKEELVVVFDVGSASIGGALISITHDHDPNVQTNPKIIYSVRKPMVFQDTLDFSRFIFAMLQTLEAVAKDIETQKLGAPKKIFCTLSSPWYASQTRTIRFKKNTPFIFSKKLWSELVEKEIAAFEAEELKKYSEEGETPRIIEQKTMHITLNGYQTPEPLGKKASELELSLFISISSKKIIDGIEEELKHFFHMPVVFSSFLFSSFIAVRDVFSGEKNFLVVDVAGELTDVGLIKDSVLAQSASFPQGKNFIARHLSEDLKRSGSDVITLINLLIAGALDKAMKPKIEELLSQARTKWLSGFQTTLANLSNDLSLPSTIFLTADPDMATWFQDAIKTEEFNQYSLTEKQFNVILIGKESLHQFVTPADTSSRDPFLMLEAIFINRILKQ